MKRFSKQLHRNQKGISLAELVIVMPIATIISVTLISILFTQYISVLAESSRSNLRSSGLAMLTTLQDELLFTIEYGHDLNVDLNDPNEPVGGWDYNTDPQTLIIHEIALDGTRVDSDRNIIRQRLSDCATSQVTANPVALNNIIYFVEDNPSGNYDRLVKRTVVPTYPTCSIDRSTGNPCDPVTSTCLGNAKELTCPESTVGLNGCNKADSVLSENIIDFSIRYFQSNNIETSFPSAAEKIEVTLLMGDTVYGRDVEVEVNHTIRKIN